MTSKLAKPAKAKLPESLQAIRNLIKERNKTLYELAQQDLPSTHLKKMLARKEFKNSIFVRRDYDLRACLEEKATACHVYASWTAFVNRAGTLVHVLPQEGDWHIRIPLYFSAKNSTDKHIEKLILAKLAGRVSQC